MIRPTQALSMPRILRSLLLAFRRRIKSASLKKIIENTLSHATTKKKKRAVIAISQMPYELTKQVFIDFSGIDIVIEGQPSSFAPKNPERLSENGPLLVAGGRQGQYFTVLTLNHVANRTAKPLRLDNREFDKNERVSLLNARINS